MASYWIKYGNSVLHRNGYAVGKSNYDPYNPLGLPPYTIRCKFSAGYVPTMGESQTLVDATENIWDITRNSSTDWTNVFYYTSSLLEVLGANATGVTNMHQMFMGCTSLTSVSLFDTSSVTSMDYTFKNCDALTSVPLFDTSSVTNMQDMFAWCSSLTSVPLFDTSSVTNMWEMFIQCTSLTRVPLFDTSSVTNMRLMFLDCSSLTSIPLFATNSATDMYSMFERCTAVESGALALYRQASSQSTPPASHSGCFSHCGSSAAQDAPIHAEMAQIPRSWGGTMA